jgi:hypothetical protein
MPFVVLPATRSFFSNLALKKKILALHFTATPVPFPFLSNLFNGIIKIRNNHHSPLALMSIINVSRKVAGHSFRTPNKLNDRSNS